LELARRSEDLGFARAPLLYLQAGRALILANDITQGSEQIKNAFLLLSEQGHSARLASIVDRTCAELARLGHRQLADDLRQQATKMMDDGADQTVTIEDEWQLPPKCSQCGATIHPDEVEILADRSAACAYCGSRILAPGGSG
jgi:DNA-directed RNA polymerase subunit RPC12/RpoP